MLVFVEIMGFVAMAIWHINCGLTLSPKCHQLLYSHTLPLQIPSKQALTTLLTTNCLIKIHPFYKWSQNSTHIQVKIQFKLSSETTPCQKVLYQEKILKYDRFQVDVVCLHADSYLIYYQLAVKMYKSVNYHVSGWKSVAGKEIVLEAMKAPAPFIWKYLYSVEMQPEKKPKIWWEMLKKYEDDLGMLIDQMDIGEEDVEISAYIRENQRNVVRNRNSQGGLYAGVQFYCFGGGPQYLASWL